MANSRRTYRAFISYRQLDPDRKVAETLHRELERYCLPRDVAEGESRSLGTFYLDKHEIPAGSLSTSITTALEQSEFLIVVCSPNTPESEWIASEG